ncbi:MAG: peptidoglycan DD-metalloendopeptidase family protein [Methyloversatilis sp.]|nr:peptidoglycan DD-metalloendopeptidase family protein [Methyloversatilis sp.]
MNRSLFAVPVLCLLLASCAGTRPAPVEVRPPMGTSSTAAPATPPAAAAAAQRSAVHVVAKGDTLFSIALEYGQDWRDLVIWNRLENPNLIKLGQELRVAAPEGGMETRPIAAPGVESRPIDTPAPSAPAVTEPSPAVADAMLKREPRGGVEPYSEATLDRIRSAGITSQPPGAAVVATTPAPPAATAAAAGTSAPVIVTPPDAVRTEDGVEWSWPASGRIIGRFGEGSNKGVDVAGRTGDPVLAAAGGRVVYAGEAMRGYGKLVIVKHDNTFLSAYAHNSKILVQERDTVKRGQRIAELGDSDTEAGKPRLHFEIRRQGKPVDPMKYLPPR